MQLCHRLRHREERSDEAIQERRDEAFARQARVLRL